MKIILSPVCKMKEVLDEMEPQGLPVYVDQAEEILSWMRQQSRETLRALWNCGDRIAEQNFERLDNMDLRKGLTPAIFSYAGSVYQYMAPLLFNEEEIAYVQKYVRILSGFYGVLKPLDGVKPHRLRMQAKANVGGSNSLYNFWGSRLYEEVRDESGVIISLASEGYSRCIKQYLTEEDTYLNITFYEKPGEHTRSRVIHVQMAKAQMIRYMAEKRVKNLEDLKKFDRMGYVFCEAMSSDENYVFERTGGLA